MDFDQLRDFVVANLEDSNARDIQALDVRGRSSFTDLMVIATGRATTHIRAVASKLEAAARDQGIEVLGAEVGNQPEWALIDLGSAVVHVMTEQARVHYSLERLWSEV